MKPISYTSFRASTWGLGLSSNLIFTDGFETLAPENIPPIANAGPDRILLEGTQGQLNANNSSDPDGTISQYQWQQLSGPTIGFPDPTYGINSRSPALHLPPVDADTDAVMRLTVTDNDGATASDEVTISILEYIPPIVFAGTDQVVARGDSVILRGVVSGLQPGNFLELRFQWQQLEGSPAIIRYGENHRHIEVTPVQAGEILVFEVTITDWFGSSSTDTVILTIVEPGSGDSLPPIANAGVDHVSLAPRMLHLDGSASYDPDGSIVEYYWETLSSPGGFARRDEIGPDPLYYGSFTNAGVYLFRLTVTDNTGATASDEVTVTVPDRPQNGNQPPVVDAGTHSSVGVSYWHMDDEYNLNGTASDPDGSIVSTQWYQVSGPVATDLIDSDKLNAKFVFAPYYGPANGQQLMHEHIFLLVATDDQGASKADFNRRYIGYVNSSPQVVFDRENILMLEGTSNQVSGIYSYDPDSFIDQHQWEQYYGPAVTFSDSTMLTPMITLPQVAGLAGIGLKLTVTDRDGLSKTGSTNLWMVSRTHQAQNLDIGEDLLAAPGEVVSLNAEYLSTNLPTGLYRWVQLTGPAISIEDQAAWNTSFIAPEVSQTTEIVLAFVRIAYPFGVQTILDADPISITITPVFPPIANAGPPQTLLELTLGQLDGSGSSDPDGTISQYQWQQTQGPLASIENPNAALTNIITPAVGADTILIFELTVTDNQGLSSTASTTVTVQPDITDGDIDGDGIADENDLFPNDSDEAYDFDGDGIGDNADADRDGDGTDNDSDWYPNDPSLNAVPVLTITSPLEGATHNSGRLRVTGTLSAPPNTGITVNGIVARLGGDPYGSEFAVMIPLESGSQEISVIATSLSRKQLTETITVTGGTQDLFLAYADPGHAFAPATTKFNIIDLNQTNIERIELDFDGNGSIDETIESNFTQAISHEYIQPDIHLPVITVVDLDGNSYRHELVVGIETEAQLDQLMQQVWSGMNAALVAGNLGLAQEYLLTEGTEESYGLVFYLLLPHMPDVIASYSSFQSVAIELSYGEYLLNRDIDGIDRAFFVYLIIDGNGVWRIGSM
ncbi:MAG: PKD domain-containing protein [Xanthomonadales bacterium]|nr:PKD domain-containing protein [Xanthomonadales bacterium]